MRERATVVKAAGKIATVRIVKNPQCESCGAAVGDSVTVACEKDNRTLASFLVYIVPVLFAGLGVLIGFFVFEKEVYTVLLCLGMLAAGFAAVVIFDRILSKSKGFGMEVVEIINTEQQEDNHNGT